MIFVPYGDSDALAAVLDDTVAAVIVEPVQGENGVWNRRRTIWSRYVS